MARRERTTALPRPRPRPRKQTGSRRIAGIEIGEGGLRALILGGALLLLLAVFGAIAWRIYDQQVRRPEQVILQVGPAEVKLNYYADRLLGWLQENQQSGASTSVLEDQLVSKLEREELTKQLAADRGITISNEDINQGIADSLGISAATSGSTFDTQYRQKRDELKMSDSSYRRMVAASVANDRLLEQFKNELGSEGEQVQLRSVIVTSKESADAILDRIRKGEDMGTIAQTESNDLETRQQDGLMQPEPEKLLPENVRAAVQGKSQGELLGPVEVQGNWWVFRLEKRESTAYTDAQKDQLANLQMDELITQKRAQTKIERDLDADDIAWAEDQVR